jgi:hypothetical protein
LGVCLSLCVRMWVCLTHTIVAHWSVDSRTRAPLVQSKSRTASFLITLQWLYWELNLNLPRTTQPYLVGLPPDLVTYHAFPFQFATAIRVFGVLSLHKLLAPQELCTCSALRLSQLLSALFTARSFGFFSFQFKAALSLLNKGSVSAVQLPGFKFAFTMYRECGPGQVSKWPSVSSFFQKESHSTFYTVTV